MRRHCRPAGVDDQTVAAVGKLTEALETVERARGHLYEFHQLVGSANAHLESAVQMLRRCGHVDLADQIGDELVGRNVLPGRWTFQVLEEFDDGYWSCFHEHEQRARRQLLAGRRHVYEAELKEGARSVNADGSPAPWHAATPESGT